MKLYSIQSKYWNYDETQQKEYNLYNKKSVYNLYYIETKEVLFIWRKKHNKKFMS